MVFFFFLVLKHPSKKTIRIVFQTMEPRIKVKLTTKAPLSVVALAQCCKKKERGY